MAQARPTLFDEALLDTEPFAPLRDAWLFSGDGGGRVARGAVGEWALRRIGREEPTAIVAEARRQIAANRGSYFEVGAVRGADIDRVADLGPGLSLVPAKDVPVEWRALRQYEHTPPVGLLDCCVLRQDYGVTPGFVDGRAPRTEKSSETVPDRAQRYANRELVRAAMLLETTNAIELPMISVLADPATLLAAPGGRYGAPFAPFLSPPSMPLDAGKVEERYRELRQFASGELDVLMHAIDRLGRARTDPLLVDKALDLGLAAEILFTHGNTGGNSEVRHKLGMRAAWLIGEDVATRLAIFDQARALYDARSKAAHEGKLPRRSAFEAATADRLVVAALDTIIAHGSFPDWDRLTMGEPMATST